MHAFGYSRLRREVQDILIAVFGLTLSFSISIYSHNSFRLPVSMIFYFLGLSLAAVCLAFLAHELAHRQVARRYGGYAEFRLWPMGLLGGLIFSFLGFVLAAPGAVYMEGVFGNERIGKTALAGPFTNLALGLAFLVAGFLLNGTSLGFPMGYLSQINLYLGAFNMIPFAPLDGQKVMSWNMRLYIVTFGSMILLAVLSYIIF